MMPKYNGKKISAKLFATRIVKSNLESSAYWQEGYQVDCENMTERERAKVDLQVSKLIDRFSARLERLLYDENGDPK